MGLALVIILVVAATQIPLQRARRARRERRDPALTEQTWSERYRASWSSERYTPIVWSSFGVVGVAFLALLLFAITRVSDTNGQRAFYAVGAALALTYSVASFVQGWRAARR